MLNSVRYKLLLKQHKNRIYGYALYMLRNRMDADDVTQEVLIRIWKNIDKFEMKAAPAWIMKTTHNLCLDYLRKRQVMNKREKDIDPDIEDKIAEGDKLTDPEIKVRQEFLKNKIKDAIENLPANLKGTFVMYELQRNQFEYH